VKIPEVYADITQELPGVIMMEYIEGMTINKVLKEDYEDFAKQVVKFGIVTTTIHGLSHGDLHAGNILFIKDETDATHKHKIGVLDFGITYEIDEKFRGVFFGLLGDMFVSPSEDLAERVLTSGIIEPIEIIQNLPRSHYKNIIDLLSKILHDVIHSSGGATQLKFYKFLSAFNLYMKDNKLTELGLKPSDNLVKTQLSLAMSHGITLTLCKDDYMQVMDKVVNELFHTDMLRETDN
jgi:predicted unusual protein kinase regulating ubiquinone biosynthesis (AarF/ABC1/UbiB family)